MEIYKPPNYRLLAYTPTSTNLGVYEHQALFTSHHSHVSPNPNHHPHLTKPTTSTFTTSPQPIIQNAHPKMLIPSLTTLLSTALLLPLASATAIPQSILPTGQTVKQDVINIHNAVLELDATVQAYDGSPFPTSLVDGTPVLLGVAKIHTVNRAGFRHALAAPPFSIADSRDVIDTVTDTGMCCDCLCLRACVMRG